MKAQTKKNQKQYHSILDFAVKTRAEENLGFVYTKAWKFQSRCLLGS